MVSVPSIGEFKECHSLNTTEITYCRFSLLTKEFWLFLLFGTPIWPLCMLPSVSLGILWKPVISTGSMSYFILLHKSLACKLFTGTKLIDSNSMWWSWTLSWVPIIRELLLYALEKHRGTHLKWQTLPFCGSWLSVFGFWPVIMGFELGSY